VTVPSARGQATEGAGGCTSQCTAMCSAWFVSVPQGKWLRRTLNQAAAASHMLSSPFFTHPTTHYVMVCGRPNHFIYGHLFTSIQGGFQQIAEPMVMSYRLLPVTHSHSPSAYTPGKPRRPAQTDISLPLHHDGVRPICSATRMSAYMQSFHSTSLIFDDAVCSSVEWRHCVAPY
jgi:hypothetical protein